MNSPRFASALSTRSESSSALEEALERLAEDLGEHSPEFVCAFSSPHHSGIHERLGQRIAATTGADVVAGCTAEGVIGEEREVERAPALALWAMASGRESGAPKAYHVHARALDTESGRFTLEGAPTVEHPDRAAIILLADPFSFPTVAFLDLLHERHPGLPVIGGMASGASAPGGNCLFTREGSHRHGALAIVVEGAIGVRPVVSQGCRPVGEPFVVTDTKDNIVKALGGKPAASVLRGMLEGLSVEESRLFRTGPFLGFAVDSNKSEFDRSDFLVRGILGVDLKAGSLAVSDNSVRRGTTVQFLVRDAASAGEDLSHALVQHGGGPVRERSSAGALLFSCNGRGTRMFKDADHDVSLVRKGLGIPISTAGFFAMGEVGPVGSRNFLHGFTASVALFRARD